MLKAEPKSLLPGNGIFRAETKRPKRLQRVRDAVAETKSQIDLSLFGSLHALAAILRRESFKFLVQPNFMPRADETNVSSSRLSANPLHRLAATIEAAKLATNSI